ncbi:MAG: tetratricopeptide repeat protein [Chloroherpetonaceae bacterium]|nr:tetratricopeptide repeat protein [Chloroherpetonaceae bacterium]
MPSQNDIELALKSSQTTEEKVRACIAFVENARFNEPRRALERAEEALSWIGEREDLAKEKADLLFFKGDSLWRLSDYAPALECLQSALALYETLGDKRGVANALNDIGNVHSNVGDYSNARRFHQQSLAIRRELGDKQGVAKSLGNLGGVCLALADYSQALRYYQECLLMFEEIGDKRNVANALNLIGNAYCSLADYPSAMQRYQQSLDICQSIGDKRGTAHALLNVGNVYYNLANYDDALRYYRQSLEQYQEIGDKRSMASVLNNIGLVYEELSNHSESLRHYEESLAICRDIGDRSGVARALNNLGNARRELANYAEAIDCHQECIRICQDIGDKRSLVFATMNLALSQSNLGLRVEAEKGFRQALELADELGLKDIRYQTLRHLAELCAQTGRYEEAYRTHVAFYEARQEVFNRETQEKLSQLQARFETEQARKQAELKQKEAEIFRLRNIELAQANEKMLSSIQYAFRIQSALLPSAEKIGGRLKEWFALYKPQAIVSGDFYWFYDYGEGYFVAVGDCTGHGVPGAFMSILAMSYLNQIVVEGGERNVAEILRRMDEMIRETLCQGETEFGLVDGAEMGLLRVEEGAMRYGGAGMPMYVGRVNGAQAEVKEVKGARRSVGGYGARRADFEEISVELTGEERAYLITDGYADMGDEKGRRFGRKRLKELLKEIASLPMSEQKRRLEKEMETYQKGAEQRDDVTIFGFVPKAR